MDFGEALVGATVSEFSKYAFFAVVIFGGFALINPRLKRTPSLRAKQVMLFLGLCVVAGILASVVVSFTGVDWF